MIIEHARHRVRLNDANRHRMSRLNATIKLLHLLGVCLLLVLSSLVILLSSLALSDRQSALNTLGYFLTENQYHKFAIYAVVTSSALFLASVCCGCCGSIRQINRKGYLSGRRVLGLFQLCLAALFVASTSSMIIVERRTSTLRSVLVDPVAFPQDPFEKQLGLLFNDAYFETVCSSSQSNTWLNDWIGNRCPPTTGRHEVCAFNRSDLLACDADCEDRLAASGNNIDSDLQCCAAETLCLSGVVDACPYHACQSQVLELATKWLHRLGLAARAVAILSIIMITLTCLLICYNPRDDVELELYKAGVFTAKDVESFKRLKQEKLFTFDARGSGRSKRTSINLDQLHERVTRVQSGLQSGVKRGRAAALGAGARAKGRRHSKVSPNPSPASSVV